jgi:hypothetical protein
LLFRRVSTAHGIGLISGSACSALHGSLLGFTIWYLLSYENLGDM